MLFLIVMCSLHGAMRTGESCVNLISAPFRAAFVDNHDKAQEKIKEHYNDEGMRKIPHPGSSASSGVRAIIKVSQARIALIYLVNDAVTSILIVYHTA